MAVSVEEMAQAIERYMEEVKASPADRQLLNGSTWFNGRYKDYLGDDYTPAPQIAGTKQPPKNERPGAAAGRWLRAGRKKNVVRKISPTARSKPTSSLKRKALPISGERGGAVVMRLVSRCRAGLSW